LGCSPLSTARKTFLLAEPEPVTEEQKDLLLKDVMMSRNVVVALVYDVCLCEVVECKS
jgi:hypothetical protein